MATTIYLVRHAEAEGNLYRRIHGWYDSLVTDNGYRQIARLKERFRDIHVDAVYSSDLFRTRTTAAAVYRPKGLPLHTRSDLREVSMGEWEDLNWGEVAHFEPERYALYSICTPGWKNPSGESREEARVRIRRAILDIAAHHPDQAVAVFAHGDIIRCFQAEVLNVPVAEMPSLGHCENTGITCVKVDGEKLEMVFRNDADHIAPEISTLGRQRWWRELKNPMADANAWFRPYDREQDGPFCCKLREGAWRSIYGSLEGCRSEDFLRELARKPENVWCAMLGDRLVGVVQLDPDRFAREKAGHISFLALQEEYKGRGLGPQLLGQAVSRFRRLGYDRVRLLCSPKNRDAVRFYANYGFYQIGTRPGHAGTLDLMEKNIGYEEPRQ